MSPGSTRQMMAFRTLMKKAVFTADQLCERCGYNLRGLPLGRRCPECSAPSPMSAGSPDPLLGHPESARKWLAVSLTAIGIMLLVAVFGRLIILGVGVLNPVGIAPGTRVLYLALLSLQAIVFAGGAWLATPPSFAAHIEHFRMRWMLPIRILALLWIPGVVLLMFVTGGANDDLLRALSLLLRTGGGISMLMLALMYIGVAQGAGLDLAADRLRWILLAIPFSMLAAIAPPTLTWVAAILLFIVLVIWGCILFVVARGFLELGYTAGWAEVLSSSDIGREERIAARRAEMDAAVRSTVRPLPISGREIDGA